MDLAAAGPASPSALAPMLASLVAAFDLAPCRSFVIWSAEVERLLRHRGRRATAALPKLTHRLPRLGVLLRETGNVWAFGCGQGRAVARYQR